jgi:alpha-galactosidase/6-phospho-beta-glucosidase family protein
VEAALEGNKEKAMQALLNDPLCSHLPKSRIRQMGEELLAAHKPLLPRPFGTAPSLKV